MPIDSLTSLSADFVANIYVSDDGKLHKIQGGADSVLPFNNGWTKLTSVYNTGFSGYSRDALTRTITPKLSDGNYVFIALWGYYSDSALFTSSIKTFTVDGKSVSYTYDRTISGQAQTCSLIANITLKSSSSIVWTATYTENPIIRIFKIS